METKIALIGIMIHQPDAVERTNQILHEYADYIVGRMGIPYRSRGVNIISVTLDAPEPVISALAGKLGQIRGISVKSMIAKEKTNY
jgi:putative iron-only hydrogenase system regulator